MAVIRINEIIDRLLAYLPQADTSLVQKAYVWSAKLHAGSLRASGLPYLSHPLEVAGILTELKLNESAIAAGLLHDVLEDSSITLKELEEVFGKEVARLVDGVTKIARIPTDMSRIEVMAENYRKIILAMAQDIRVIFIKLADRLHNMQTLEFLEEDRRRVIAQETMELYAPIAGRLGIYWIQAQLEDLSFRHLKPDIYFRLAAQVAKTREARQEYIAEVQTILSRKLREAGITAEITGRFKHIYSIYRKMEKQKLSFEEVHDIIAFRILVASIPLCYDTLRVIHSLWTPVPGRIKDYIALPKPNLYRSLHTTVIGPLGERVEVQIRTPEMHAVAEYGIAAHWRYKEAAGRPGKEAEEKALGFLHHLVEFQEEMKDPYHFLDSLKAEVIPNQIVVFTPKGDMIELPAGATPIDFAYAIHSDIGNRSAGAKVNGRIVPLNYQLQSGETVEILTSQTVEPSRAWQELVKTPRAKAKIGHWISAKENLRARELGRQTLETELLRHHRSLVPLLEDGTLQQVANRFSFPSVNRLLEDIGFEKFPVRKVLLQLIPAQELRGATGAKRFARRPEFSEPPEADLPQLASSPLPTEPEESVITIKSYDDPVLAFASCCSPLVGEEITAVREEAGIVVIHRADCHKALELPRDRLLRVRWAKEVEGETTATIEVFTQDQKGMLARLSSVISEANINIERALVRTTEEKKALHSFALSLKNSTQLQRIIKGIEKVEGVISVHRV